MSNIINDMLFIAINTKKTSLRCHWQTRATRYIRPSVLYTDVDGPCDRLVTEDCHQFITLTIHLSWHLTAPETIDMTTHMVGANQSLNVSRDLTTPLSGMLVNVHQVGLTLIITFILHNQMQKLYLTAMQRKLLKDTKNSGSLSRTTY